MLQRGCGNLRPVDRDSPPKRDALLIMNRELREPDYDNIARPLVGLIKQGLGSNSLKNPATTTTITTTGSFSRMIITTPLPTHPTNKEGADRAGLPGQQGHLPDQTPEYPTHIHTTNRSHTRYFIKHSYRLKGSNPKIATLQDFRPFTAVHLEKQREIGKFSTSNHLTSVCTSLMEITLAQRQSPPLVDGALIYPSQVRTIWGVLMVVGRGGAAGGGRGPGGRACRG